jgi:hypothetical protein
VKVPNAGATLHQSHHKESKGACTHPDLPRDTLSPHLFRAYNVDRLVRSAGERNKSSIKTAGFNTTWNINYTYVVGAYLAMNLVLQNPRSLHNWSCHDIIKTKNEKLWSNT